LGKRRAKSKERQILPKQKLKAERFSAKRNQGVPGSIPGEPPTQKQVLVAFFILEKNIALADCFCSSLFKY